MPIATWMAPILLLRYSRQSSTVAGQLILGLVLIGASYPMLHGIIPPFLGMFALVLTVYYGFLVYLPYGIDRLLAKRINGFASTLVLPTVAVLVDYFAGISFGTWNSVAYTQHANLPLVQIISVTGMWGITFLVFWTAAVINRAWDRQFEPRRITKEVLILGSVFLAVFLYGGLRLALADSPSETVVAGAIADGRTGIEYRENLESTRSATSDNPETNPQESVADIFNAFTDDLLTLTRDAADRGARIVLWPESVAIIPEAEEAILRAKATKLARELKIYIALAYFKIPPDDTESVGENKTEQPSPIRRGVRKGGST